jgi:RNA polymerase sigma factor (sigma-70 family)
MTLGQDFETILAAARAGGEWAWVRLYDDMAPVVMGYVRGRNASEPEDITGEVFLQVARDLSRFEGDERALRAWALTIARNRLIDEARYRFHRPVAPAPDDLLHHRAPVGNVEQEALESVATERVRDIISELTRDQQEVLLLRIIGQLTVEEVGAVMGRRPGSIKALQRRGLARIRQQLLARGVTL